MQSAISVVCSRQFKFPMVDDDLMVDDMMAFADEDDISQVSSQSQESWEIKPGKLSRTILSGQSIRTLILVRLSLG